MDVAWLATYPLSPQVLTLDTQLLEEVFDDSFDPLALSPWQLREGIRRLTLSCEVVPVLCGSAFRNTGVQPLLAAVTHFLPSPLETTVHMSVLTNWLTNLFSSVCLTV